MGCMRLFGLTSPVRMPTFDLQDFPKRIESTPVLAIVKGVNSQGAKSLLGTYYLLHAAEPHPPNDRFLILGMKCVWGDSGSCDHIISHYGVRIHGRKCVLDKVGVSSGFIESRRQLAMRYQTMHPRVYDLTRGRVDVMMRDMFQWGRADRPSHRTRTPSPKRDRYAGLKRLSSKMMRRIQHE